MGCTIEKFEVDIFKKLWLVIYIQIKYTNILSGIHLNQVKILQWSKSRPLIFGHAGPEERLLSKFN